MVLPARIADGNLGVGQQLAQKVCTDFQCPGSTERLHGDGPAASNDGRVLAQEQLLRAEVVTGNSFDGQIATGGMRLHASQLGTLYRFQ